MALLVVLAAVVHPAVLPVELDLLHQHLQGGQV
jgi:hypothetical protein